MSHNRKEGMCYNYRYNLEFIQLHVLKEIGYLLRIPDKFSCLFLFAVMGSNRRDAKGTREKKRRVKQTFVSQNGPGWKGPRRS